MLAAHSRALSLHETLYTGAQKLTTNSELAVTDQSLAAFGSPFLGEQRVQLNV